jgi:hypothetical protein
MGETPVPEESLRDKAIKMLFEMAAEHWRLGHRWHAMKLHRKATNLQIRIVDNDL